MKFHVQKRASNAVDEPGTPTDLLVPTLGILTVNTLNLLGTSSTEWYKKEAEAISQGGKDDMVHLEVDLCMGVYTGRKWKDLAPGEK